jgi:phage-related protein
VVKWLKTVNDTVRDGNGHLVALGNKVDALGDKIDDGFSDVTGSIDAAKTFIGEKIDAHKYETLEKLDGLGVKIDDVGNAIFDTNTILTDSFASLQTATENGLSNVKDSVDGLGPRIDAVGDSIESAESSLGAKIDGVASAVGDVGTKIDGVASAVGELGGKVDGVAGAVNTQGEAITGAVNGLGTKIDGVTGAVNDLAEQLEEDLDTEGVSTDIPEDGDVNGDMPGDFVPVELDQTYIDGLFNTILANNPIVQIISGSTLTASGSCSVSTSVSLLGHSVPIELSLCDFDLSAFRAMMLMISTLTSFFIVFRRS